MKKILSICSIIIGTLILCGYANVPDTINDSNIESIIGKGERTRLILRPENEYEGKSIRESKISTKSLKRSRISHIIRDENVSNALDFQYWEQYTNKFIYSQLPPEIKNYWNNLDTIYQPYLLSDKSCEKNECLYTESFDTFTDLFEYSTMYLYCHPQYFFLKPYMSAYKSDNGYVLEIEMYDDFKKGETRLKAVDEIRNKLDEWKKQINYCSTNYGKIKKIHDLICAKVSYDYRVTADDYDWDTDPLYSQSIYSGIHTDKMVCAGYAKLFNCLANASSLETMAINGSGHAWNVVILDGKWFYLDSTWDDCISNYRYFLVAQKEFDDESHNKNYYWNKYITEPEYTYRSLRYQGNEVFYSYNKTPFGYYSIDYILGQGNILDYSNLSYLQTEYSIYTKTIILSKGLSRFGYKFKGWYYNNRKVNKIKTNGEDILIYAKWEPIKYNIAFKKATKNVSTKQISGKMKTIKNVEYDSAVHISKNEFVRPGYKFIGWTTNKNGTTADILDGSTMVNLAGTDTTVKLYALWEKEE